MFRQSLPQTRQNADGPAFFSSFQKEMNRLLEQFRTGFPMPDAETRDIFTAPSFPAIDVIETDDGLEISAEVPGVKEDEMDVTISGANLVIKGEKSADHEIEEDNYHMVERRYGSFRRHIPLGFTPAEDAVEAEFKDGILKLRIAKPAAAKADVQKIDIKKS